MDDSSDAAAASGDKRADGGDAQSSLFKKRSKGKADPKGVQPVLQDKLR